MTELEPADPREDLACLEAFVLDNDDLVSLEEQIGRFNIFDALRIVRAEIRHSNFLAWLLDPTETHGNGPIFLRAVLMDMLRNTPYDLRPLSPVELDGLDLGAVDIRREYENIDLLITSPGANLVVAIENKIESSEHSSQLQRYRDLVERRSAGKRALFVFLTRDRSEPSDDAWTPYGYADLHAALSRVRRLHHDSMGEDVIAFLDHYLRMIGSRFMDDPKIDELCDRIYRNHRRALDLIFERRADPRQQLIAEFTSALADTGFPGTFSDRTSTSCRFSPTEWLEILPPVNARPQLPERDWIALSLRINAKMTVAQVTVQVGPTTDPDARKKILDAIQERGTDFGFKLNRSKLTERWTRVYGQTVLRTKEPFEADETNKAKIRRSAEEMPAILEQMTSLLREVFDGERAESE